MVDLLEKLGRLVLWLALASACVLAPITYIRLQREERTLQESERKEVEAREKAEKERELAEKHPRLSLKSMGMYMGSLQASDAQGRFWFTNVSPRSGALCVVGVATNPNSRSISTSLPACEQVGPYSSVMIKAMFAGSDLNSVCKGVTCEFGAQEAP
jgi:hypothetical protein